MNERKFVFLKILFAGPFPSVNSMKKVDIYCTARAQFIYQLSSDKRAFATSNDWIWLVHERNGIYSVSTKFLNFFSKGYCAHTVLLLLFHIKNALWILLCLWILKEELCFAFFKCIFKHVLKYYPKYVLHVITNWQSKYPTQTCFTKLLHALSCTQIRFFLSQTCLAVLFFSYFAKINWIKMFPKIYRVALSNICWRDDKNFFVNCCTYYEMGRIKVWPNFEMLLGSILKSMLP